MEIKYCSESSSWQLVPHTEEPSFRLLDGVLKKTLVHWRCFMTQASPLFPICHLHNGFSYYHSTCQTCSSKSSLHSWTWDLLTSTSVNLCLKLLSREPPITQAVDSRKLVFWLCCGFGSARPLPVRVSSSCQVPLDGVGNCPHWHLGFLCNFSKGKTYTFKGYIVLSVFLLLVAFFSPLWPQYTTSCSTILSK